MSYEAYDAQNRVVYTNISVFSKGISRRGSRIENLELERGRTEIHYYIRDSSGAWRNGSWTLSVDSSPGFS